MDLLRIEDGDIGKVILPQQAAVAQMLALRRQRSKFANGCFQRQQVFVAHVFAQNAGKRAVRPGMRFGIAQRAFGIDGAVVVVHADPGLLHGQPHIGLAHLEINRAGVVVVGDDEIEHSVKGILVFRLRDLRQVLAFVFFQLWIQHRDDENAVGSTGAAPHIFRGAHRRRFQLFADLRARGGIFQPADEGIGAAGVILRRDDRAQRSGRGNVRILIGVDVYALGARLLHRGDGLRHLAPVLLTRGFEVKNLHRDVGFAADTKGFIQRLHFAVAFVANMRRVDAAAARRHFGQGNQFFGRSIIAGRVDERGRDTQGAIVHSVVHHLFHLLQFLR